MLYIINETLFYGSSHFMLNVISFISVLLGVYVIISKNPVISILFLIGLFFAISLYLIIIGLHFLGLSYLLVYIGAVSIFFIFIIMLINIRVSELLTDNRNSGPLALLTVLIFNYIISGLLPIYSLYDINTEYVYNILDTFVSSDISSKVVNSNEDINLYLSDYVVNVSGKSWDGLIIFSSHVSSIGSILYTNLFILIILISLILLLAMIGAIVITINKLPS